MERISVKTHSRQELQDITAKIQESLAKTKIKDGVCFVFCPHTTAGVTINENADPAVQKDMIFALNKIIPAEANYEHAEGNSDAHLKSSLFGSSLTILVEHGLLLLGAWQGIYFCENDGPRTREVWVKVVDH